jgi:hypothetical protein
MPNLKYIGGEGAPESGTLFGLEVTIGAVVTVDVGHVAAGHRWFEKTDAAPVAIVSRETLPEIAGNAFSEPAPVAVAPVAPVKNKGGRPRKVMIQPSGVIGETAVEAPKPDDPAT